MVSKEIAKYMTGKKSLFTSDKLVMADVDSYAEIYSKGGKGKIPATIGFLIRNHANTPTIDVYGNMSPSEVEELFEHIKDVSIKKGDWSWKQTVSGPGKIIAAVKDKDGLSPVKNIEIVRAELDKEGKQRGYPWFIKITNGVGKAIGSATGGTKCESGSFKKTGEEFVSLTDSDIYEIFQKTARYILLWELTNVPSNIRAGQNKFMAELEEYKASKAAS